MKDPLLSRRQLLALPAASPWLATRSGAAVVRRHDERVATLLNQQITDPGSPWRGASLDQFGLCFPVSASGMLEAFAAAFLHPASRFHRDLALVERMRLAAGYLERAQNPQGNIDLVTTNFNSPPDTAFVVHGVATMGVLARRAGERELEALAEPFLRRAAAALATGGVHTPNHRWVICSALAQVNELYPHPAWVRRIDQWLAEGVDIDGDGQYTERSTAIYNAVTNRALVVMAAKLARPELLEPVRRNLECMLYLLHPGGEVVTEISRRQDAGERGDMGRYWFPLRYLALRDGDGRFAALVHRLEPDHASLPALMEYPELNQELPSPAPLPEDFEKHFPELGIVRLRRGPVSATIFSGTGRFFALRHGEAVMAGLRVAAAFFGKGQFVPQRLERSRDGWELSQRIEAGYYQPLDPPRRVTPAMWYATQGERRQSEICQFEYRATVTELRDGFRVRLQAAGTPGVPVAVEINFREGGELQGCEPAPDAPQAWLLRGEHGTYRAGGWQLRFGPGRCEHRYTQVRGAAAKLPGPSVYVTGFTPFAHTLTFRTG
ncbi:MAG: hypothetical protein RMK57_03645 [Bryobacterales bacterium]|nr:hypothetical protein [Bryobacteraceae bacterium]MDW8353602.1 hypothetical protein [Bryobacterales bacterium]